MTIETPIVAAFISGIIGPLIVWGIRRVYEKRKVKPDMVAETLEVSEKVMHKLEEIKDKFGADRVWVTQFHNGGHFYPTGKSIAKFSLVYETVSLGVGSIQSSFQNIPVSLFSKSINHLLEHDIIEVTDFKDDTIATYGLKYIAEESGCKSVYILAIKTIDGKFIGSLGLDFVKKKIKMPTEVVTQLVVLATAIGGVLNTHLHDK